MTPTPIGLIGCGNISSQYLERATQFPILHVAACSDLDVSRAEAQAKQFGVPRACSVDDLLRDDAIQIVVNLTVPSAHAEVSLQAIESGKHVYTEKPLAVTTAQGRQVLDAARSRGVRVGCAPDTFLGIGHQTARHAIETGQIGRPVAAIAAILTRGPEPWHPDPEFFYKPGGGPMFDMGPYYLTDLINLLGPIRRVCGMAGILQPERSVGKGPKAGQKLLVETEDHVAGTVEFTSGAIATLTTSFACPHVQHNWDQPIQIIGTEGTLLVPDPNGFEGNVLIKKNGMDNWQKVEPTHGHPGGRSLGIADMAHAIQNGREHRASGQLAFAVLSAMEGFIESSRTGRYRELVADYQKPAMMPTDVKDGVLD